MTRRPARIVPRNFRGRGGVRIYRDKIKITFPEGSRVVRYNCWLLIAALSGDPRSIYDTEEFRIVTWEPSPIFGLSFHSNDRVVRLFVRESVNGSDLVVISWKALVKALFRIHPVLSEVFSEKKILAAHAGRVPAPHYPS